MSAAREFEDHIREHPPGGVPDCPYCQAERRSDILAVRLTQEQADEAYRWADHAMATLFRDAGRK